MRYDYNRELNILTDKLYKEVIIKLLINDNSIDILNNNIDKIKEFLSGKRVYLGSSMDDFIVNAIPQGHEGDLFRSAIAVHHKHLHPIFETQSGEVFVDSTYNNFGLLMFKSHMHDLLISDLQDNFSQNGYNSFITDKLMDFFDEISSRVFSAKHNTKVIVINYDEKKYLLNVVKNMIDRKELDIEYAYKLVDMDKLRDYMVSMSVSFDYYDEFDKLEDDTRFCLDKFCKYNAYELYDFLVNECGFENFKEGSLIKR